MEKILKTIGSILTAALLALSTFVGAIVDYQEAPLKKENFLEPVSSQTFGLFDTYLRGQSVATDGKVYYFSSNYGLIKTELDGKTVIKSNVIAIPNELLKLGCKHIGGISYMNGKIYAPIEDSKVFQHLYITVFDAETLEPIQSYPLPLEKQENGAPWCAVDEGKNFVYTARRDEIEEINVYDADTMEYLYGIPVDYPVHKIQSGQLYEGVLYVTINRGDQAIYAINMDSQNGPVGKVRKAFGRNLVDGSEGEGFAILPTEDGALFHVLDIASIRVAGHFLHYAFDPAAIDWAAEGVE